MQIKICGVTSREDAESAVRFGASAIGCVFYPQSVRAVSIHSAQDISAGIRGFSMFVALFVDPSEREVFRVLENVNVDALQFHGKETPDFCRQFDRPYIKAVPMMLGTDLREWDDKFPDARALLADSATIDRFGGGGTCFDWALIPQELSGRIILAGGLQNDNVADAVRQVKPMAVDVSSGVESAPGVKDLVKMKTFIQMARRAHEGLWL